MRTITPEIHRSTDKTGQARTAEMTEAGAPEMTEAELDRLANHLADSGTSAHTQALAGLASRIATVAPAVASVLADVQAPEVVRLRAFGRASSIVASWPRAVAATGTVSPEVGPIHYRLTA